MKMEGLQKRRNVLTIKPYRTSEGNDNEESPDSGPSRGKKFPSFSTVKDSLDVKLGGSDSGISEQSTPKRSASSLADLVKTPNNKPVVLEEEYSPIELFPFSQTQSAPIVQWDYNPVQRTRPGSLRRSRPSCGLLPSPPEIKPAKRRTPSPTVEDMPPPKKPSQECISSLQEHLMKLQALVSDSKGSDDEDEELAAIEVETEEERLGNSMHQSLHISDKFERTVASPDPFDSAPDDLINLEDQQIADPSSDPTQTASPPRPSCSSTTSTLPMDATQAPKPVDNVEDMSFEIDDSLAECLIACTEKVESEVRLSQQQQQEVCPDPKPVAAPPMRNLYKKPSPKKPSPKKALKDANNGIQRGRLQVVTVTSPKKKRSMSPNFTKKPVAAPSKRQSDGTEFSPSWMEKIKNATSPGNSSFKASQSGGQPIQRTLNFSQGNGKRQSAGTNKEAKNTPPAMLNLSIDPFEDSFDGNFDALLEAEAQALSQMTTNPVPVKPVAPINPPVIKPAQNLQMKPPPPKQIQRVSSFSNVVKPKPLMNFPSASTFQRHQSAPFLNKHQAQKQPMPASKTSSLAKPETLRVNNTSNLTSAHSTLNKQPVPSKPVPKPVLAPRTTNQTTKPSSSNGSKPLTVVFKGVSNAQPQKASLLPTEQKKPTPPAVSSNPFGSDPSSVRPPVVEKLRSSPFTRHKSEGCFGKVQPQAAAAVGSAKLGGSPLLRHRSADFGQGSTNTQKCSQPEIERKRQEALKRLAQRKQNGQPNSNNT